MEYLLVASLAFMFIIVILVIAYSNSASFSSDVGRAQIQRVGSTIIDTANTVYYAGPPTKKTVKVYFPQSVRGIIPINGTSDIIFVLQGDNGLYDYSVSAATNLTGEIRNFSGMHTLSFTATGTAVDISDR
jgi:uncharacterized protein (UPF0333 family)